MDTEKLRTLDPQQLADLFCFLVVLALTVFFWLVTADIWPSERSSRLKRLQSYRRNKWRYH